MRIFKNCYDAVNETLRDLYVKGQTIESNTYQDKKLEGEDRFVKELIGVSFIINKPLLKRKEALELIFKEDAKRIENYCIQEAKDRCSGEQLNPGNSYKIREDMWNKFLENGDKFSYTYSERLWENNQFKTVTDILRKDKGSRQGLLMIWDYNKDCKPERLGGGNRVPCSVSYQFLIREGMLNCIYYMRSNDMLGHHVIDLYLAGEMMKYMTESLKDTYPDLEVGQLHFMAGSLHAFNWDLKNWVIF